MMQVDDVLRIARSAGVAVRVENSDLVLEFDDEPPAELVRPLRRFKPELVSALRMRQADERARITSWIADNFVSSPPGICAHCGQGERPFDSFVALFVGNDRGDVHSSCRSVWLGAQEALAREALGLEASPVVGSAVPSSARTDPQ